METNNFDARVERGLAMSKKEGIFENLDGSFVVPSQSRKDVKYEVRAIGATWVCNCPDFETRADSISACKHIHAVRFWVAAKVELEQKPKPKVFADDAVQCDRCGSIQVIRYGSSGAKQTYYCKGCDHKFTPSLLKRTHYTPEMVTLTLDLYFSGMSLRKVARTLNDNFGMTLGATTIYRWIQTFVPRISEYVNSLAPQLSETWQADELFVKMRGGVHTNQYDLDGMAFLWNVMDRKTRFLLASKVSKHRDDYGAVRAFAEAIKNAHDNLPEKVFTDGLNSYRDPIKFGFKGQVQHIARMGVGKPHANNNRVERLNGTLRERVKVQRGWKSYQTPLAEGQRIAYNFVKPHMALEGQTPSQAAGLTPKGWAELLRAALTNQNGTTEGEQR
ncbi:MAG: IS1/IS6 family transposase [Nitrososphaerota archaeon]|nr:IS1/IS6 family transposase [Nitrososphaerota archaeon]